MGVWLLGPDEWADDWADIGDGEDLGGGKNLVEQGTDGSRVGEVGVGGGMIVLSRQALGGWSWDALAGLIGRARGLYDQAQRASVYRRGCCFRYGGRKRRHMGNVVGR